MKRFYYILKKIYFFIIIFNKYNFYKIYFYFKSTAILKYKFLSIVEMDLSELYINDYYAVKKRVTSHFRHGICRTLTNSLQKDVNSNFSPRK